MRRRTWIAIPAAAAALTLAGCGSNTTSHTNANNGSHMNGSRSMSGSSKAAAGERDTADVMFAQMMIPHHQQAIEMTKLAPSRAASPAVKALATRIQAAQTPEITTMRGWLTRWGSSMTGATTGSDGGMMNADDVTKLQALSSRAFDREFLTMMTSHHQGAIDMARAEQANGRYGPAKTMAANIVRTQTAEIVTMAALLKSA